MSFKFQTWPTLLANLGVIAGLALVAYEVNQTNEALELESKQWETEFLLSRNEMLSGFLIGIASDAELSSIWRKGNAGEELSPNANYRYQILVREWVIKQWVRDRSESVFDPTFTGAPQHLAFMRLNNPGFKRAHDEMLLREGSDPDFEAKIRDAEENLSGRDSRS